jgi:hypothetical protein
LRGTFAKDRAGDAEPVPEPFVEYCSQATITGIAVVRQAANACRRAEINFMLIAGLFANGSPSRSGYRRQLGVGDLPRLIVLLRAFKSAHGCFVVVCLALLITPSDSAFLHLVPYTFTFRTGSAAEAGSVRANVGPSPPSRHPHGA